jgi:hypothetical protein
MGASYGHAIKAEIDYNTNTIMIIVREDLAELADLDITDRFRVITDYYSPGGPSWDETSENQPGSNMVSDPEGDVGYDFIDILEGKIEYRSPSWSLAYNVIFNNSSNLALFRQYRDEILLSTTKGEIYKTALYAFSNQALHVLISNPNFIYKAKALIEPNYGAVSDVLDGYKGVISNTKEIASFLDAYAKESPLILKIFSHIVRWDMLRKQQQGDLFFGFRLK